MGHVGAARALPVRGFASAQGFLFLPAELEKSALKPKGLAVSICMCITGSCTRRLKIKINRSH